MDNKFLYVMMLSLATASVVGCADGESGDHKVPANSNLTDVCEEGTSQCSPNGEEMTCSGGTYHKKSCDYGCKDGKCLPDPNGNEPTAEPGSYCNSSFKPQCKNGTIRLYCAVDTVREQSCGEKQICVDGQCRRDPNTTIELGDFCDVSSFRGYCSNESMRILCVDGAVTAKPCNADEICDGGYCLSESVPSKGQACQSSSFKNFCKNSNVLYVCSDSKVAEVTCQNGCYKGACVSSSCEDNDVSYCATDQLAVKCESGDRTQVSCDSGTYCSNGECIATPALGSDCNRANFVGPCTNDAQYLVCVNDNDGNGKVTVATCTSTQGGQMCVRGQCVECDPDHFSVICKDSSTRTVCSAGKLVDKTCDSDAPYCFDGNCVQCINNDSFKPTCKDDKHFTSCSTDGVIITHECPGSLTCNDGKCIGDCDETHPCGDHYKCEGNACVLDKQCELSDSPVCDMSSNAVRRCVGLGWYEIQACTGSDVCVNGRCMGSECDPATYGTTCSDDGKTPQYCLDGHIIQSTTCASGICIGAGICRDCDPETYVSTHCRSNTEEYFCNYYQSNWYRKCKNNEVCEEGKGCVSKCAGVSGYTKDECLPNSNILRYCTEEGSVQTVSCTSVNELSECVEDKCVSEMGASCVPQSYSNKCYSDSYMKTCMFYEGKNQVVKMTCGSDAYCGTIDGAVNCYKRCDTVGDYNCLYNDTTAWAVKCSSGITYGNNSFNGYAKVNSFCDKGSSVSCRMNSHQALVRDHIFCASSGGTTCNDSTGLCDGLQSCTELGGMCSGGTTAMNCRMDGEVMVQTVTNCAQYNATCVEYTEDGVQIAACSGEIVQSINGESRSISTLGTCIGDVLYKLYFTGSDSAPMLFSVRCKTSCNTASSNNVTYAYCE